MCSLNAAEQAVEEHKRRVIVGFKTPEYGSKPEVYKDYQVSILAINKSGQSKEVFSRIARKKPCGRNSGYIAYPALVDFEHYEHVKVQLKQVTSETNDGKVTYSQPFFVKMTGENSDAIPLINDATSEDTGDTSTTYLSKMEVNTVEQAVSYVSYSGDSDYL